MGEDWSIVTWDEGGPLRITHVAYRMPTGEVWSCPKPARHCCPPGVTQGFLTSEGAFVDRVEALAIAQAAGQLICKTQPEDMLFSEDVW